MFEARLETENEEFDVEMQRTAWFTALIMNSSGNYKKAIKPNKLYEPISKTADKGDVQKSKDYVTQQQEELKRKFNIDK